MEENSIQSENAKTVRIKQGKNNRSLYPHQIEAIKALDNIDKGESFSTMVVLPTGAGKTATAVNWLLSAAVNKNKKILWLAHRHLLLEQAADAFSFYAHSDRVINRQSFKYRIISGQHDSPIHIKSDDDVLIASKDSLIRNLDKLDNWLKGVNELYVVVDEAHHATARSYRRILDHIKDKIHNVKTIGLTATPFRTSEQEHGLLGQIFRNGENGMVYKIDLDTLIKRGILSTPEFEGQETQIEFGNELGLNAIKSIERLDTIPDDIADYIANNGKRNRFIAETYTKNREKYGQTLVFALNRIHAFALRKVFEELGVKAGVIVSGTGLEFTGIDISDAENERQIEAYRKGEIQVLINVNILTEGADLPKTQTVFLTRPTISVVLMTQMIGRALRGEQAGGTKDAYIVSFIDNWDDKIAWVNPKSIILEEEKEFNDKDYEYKKRNIRIISIEKLEEFARIVNEAVDTTQLESIDFIKRVPVGMYIFTFIDENNMEHNHQILVYDNSKQCYDELIKSLHDLFVEFGVKEETIEPETLEKMIAQCKFAYFGENMIPFYGSEKVISRDIEYLLKYFAQKESAPLFISFEEDDRQKVNLSTIAKDIIDKDMRLLERKAHTDALWNDEKSLLCVYFGNKYFFDQQLNTEIIKQLGDYPVCDNTDNTIGEEKKLEDLPLYKWQKHAPKKYDEMKALIFSKAKKGSDYVCANCGKTSPYKGLFQIDHKTPMDKGGKTVAENLQLLCRTCNLKKGDKV